MEKTKYKVLEDIELNGEVQAAGSEIELTEEEASQFEGKLEKVETSEE